jgi:hypothetical protein
LIDWHLAEMNRSLANELKQPITVGIGIHAGEVIIGTMGYREHAQVTAIGEAVHVASRLQELTKEYNCQLVVSEVIGTTAGIPLDDLPYHQVQVRGLSTPLAIRAVESGELLARLDHSSPEDQDNIVQIYAQSRKRRRSFQGRRSPLDRPGRCRLSRDAGVAVAKVGFGVEAV